MNKTTDSSLSERELLAFVKLVRQHYREAKIKLTPGIVERMEGILGESQQSNPATLREALELAFYFAEQHVPSKEGYCAKCGFCHCDRSHVLAMAKQGVLEALAASGTEAAPCEVCNAPREIAGGEHVCGLSASGAYSLGFARGINSQAAASPEGEGREAANFSKHVRETLEKFACGELSLYRATDEITSRQSAAPSGPLRPPSKLDGSMATAPSDLSAIDYEKSYASFAAMPNEVIASRTVGQLILAKGKLDVYKAILTKLMREIRKEWLAGETGAVTETK